MKWIKKGRIFNPDDYKLNYASIPVVDLYQDKLNIYFSTRDSYNRSNVIKLVCSAEEPSKILSLSKKPIIKLGELGSFDENGIMPSWIVKNKDMIYLYYIGWNLQVSVPYKLSIGLAIKNKNTFKKISNGPILDRGITEPFFNTAPCVIKEDKIWKMWFVSCTKWKLINSKAEPQYLIRYAESTDGINWTKSEKECISYSFKDEAIARPCVFKLKDKYFMVFSSRRLKNYRTDKLYSYNLQYAVSQDGIHWIRKGAVNGLERSNEGWDSEMIEYAYTYTYNNKLYLFYNGNGFGKTGFGYAVLEDE